jgi:hypothetical protein
MKKVQIHYVEFDTNELASKNENYLHNGLFMVKIKNNNSDLRFIDKSTELNYCIVPEFVFLCGCRC